MTQHSVQFFKDTVSGHRALLGVAFSEPPPEYVVNELRNKLNSQGYEVQGNGCVYKFYCSNNHVNDAKIDLAKMALHRTGHERYDHLFDEMTDECFGCLQPDHPNYIGDLYGV